MACALERDQTGIFDGVSVGPAPVQTILFLQKPVPPPGKPLPVGITAVQSNMKPAPILNADDTISVSYPATGDYDLSVTMVGVQVHDQVQLCELCDDGTSHVLKTRRVQPAPGGGPNAIMTFVIHAK